jgi:hypothetical protein
MSCCSRTGRTTALAYRQRLGIAPVEDAHKISAAPEPTIAGRGASGFAITDLLGAPEVIVPAGFNDVLPLAFSLVQHRALAAPDDGDCCPQDGEANGRRCTPTANGMICVLFYPRPTH